MSPFFKNSAKQVDGNRFGHNNIFTRHKSVAGALSVNARQHLRTRVRIKFQNIPTSQISKCGQPLHHTRALTRISDSPRPTAQYQTGYPYSLDNMCANDLEYLRRLSGPVACARFRPRVCASRCAQSGKRSTMF